MSDAGNLAANCASHWDIVQTRPDAERKALAHLTGKDLKVVYCALASREVAGAGQPITSELRFCSLA